ncbi:hypothetical protein [Novosphingopyxis sp.]|uniref:hypothetical protein n=1 Tax=Novosphingopyxis sp. TaxID=2709690 RepID=UPI003B5ADD8A
MPHKDPVNWQPISEMPLIASMIDGALEDTREHMETLTKARTRPHVLDDATIDRTERVHTEQLEFVDIYAQQISRWRTERLSADQTRELDRMEAQNGHLRAVTADVLALASELRKGTIERVLAMSDVELGLHALLTNQPSGRR